MKPNVCPDCNKRWEDHIITKIAGSLRWVCPPLVPPTTSAQRNSAGT